VATGSVALAQNESPASSKFALTASAGSNGIGGDFTVSISDYLNTRIGYHGLNYTLDATFDDSDPEIAFDGTLSVSSFSLMVDYYPFKKFLGLSVGALLHSMDVNATAQPNAPYQVGDKTFDIEKLGKLEGTLSYESGIMPYAGIILSNPLSRGFPIKLHVQAGLIYSKAAQLQLSGSGMIAPTADQQVSLQNGLDEFQFYPIVNAGLSFRFGKKVR